MCAIWHDESLICQYQSSLFYYVGKVQSFQIYSYSFAEIGRIYLYH